MSAMPQEASSREQSRSLALGGILTTLTTIAAGRRVFPSLNVTLGAVRFREVSYVEQSTKKIEEQVSRESGREV